MKLLNDWLRRAGQNMCEISFKLAYLGKEYALH